ncbi:MAG: DUF503 domain-containing protein [Thermoleophilia bacterium]|nr:DUF503 domain-containing protein [Thermoleophilia bacterium]
MRSDASIGVLLADLHFPGTRSLKEKRGPLRSLRDVVQRRFRASFSEVGGQDTWQTSRVLIVLAASSRRQADEQLAEVDRYLHGLEGDVRVVLRTVEGVESLWDIAS